MTKYIILLVILIATGGIFLYSVQTTDAPSDVQNAVESQNPFGEPAEIVGSLSSPDTSGEGEDEAEDEFEEEDEDTSVTAGGGKGGVTTGPNTAVVTRTQLATHNTQSSCWVAYKGVVYDITLWLPRHPGSAAAIAPYCGTAEEFTAAFSKQHGTSKDARLKQEGSVQGSLAN